MLQPLTLKAAVEAADVLENRTFDEISVGNSASLTRTRSRDDIALFRGDVRRCESGACGGEVLLTSDHYMHLADQ